MSIFHCLFSWIFSLTRKDVCQKHSRSSSWEYSENKIWAATFWQTHWAGEAWNWSDFEQKQTVYYYFWFEKLWYGIWHITFLFVFLVFYIVIQKTVCRCQKMSQDIYNFVFWNLFCLEITKYFKLTYWPLDTVFPWIVSAETILFWIWS